jgi:antitoxin (DNA-binding transcriptional repressor) of toxin-antitoxin stability system
LTILPLLAIIKYGKKLFDRNRIKKNVSEVLNTVYFKGEIAVIKRYGTPVAKIVPLKDDVSKKKLNNEIDELFGAIPDFPRVEEERKFRERRVQL